MPVSSAGIDADSVDRFFQPLPLPRSYLVIIFVTVRWVCTVEFCDGRRVRHSRYNGYQFLVRWHPSIQPRPCTLTFDPEHRSRRYPSSISALVSERVSNFDRAVRSSEISGPQKGVFLKMNRSVAYLMLVLQCQSWYGNSKRGQG